MRRQHDELGVQFLGVFRDAAGRVAQPDLDLPRLDRRIKEFLPDGIVGRFDPCLRIDYSPDFTCFERRS